MSLLRSEPAGKSKLWPGTAIPAWVLALAAVPFLATAVVYAYTVVFSHFAPYDDEGFIMASVQGILTGHPLYDGVFTVYGPVYYFYEWLIHTATSLPVTHNVTGGLCMFHWLTASALLALIAYRITRSALAAVFVFVQATVHLSALANEPGHPQELIVLLLATAILAGLRGLSPRWTTATLAALGATLVFTKINIGAFYGFALLFVLACHTSFFHSHKSAFVALLLGSVCLPVLLMRPHLGDALTREYCSVACVTVAVVGAVSYSFQDEGHLSSAAWARAGIGFLSTSAIILLILCLTGSSIRAAAYCLVLAPSRMTNSFVLPLWAWHCGWSAAGSLLTAAIFLALRSRLGRMTPLLVGLKGAYGLIGTLLLVGSMRDQLGYLLPWIWLVLVPTEGGRPHAGSSSARIFLCAVAAWQGLQAYPVAGTQVSIATFLPILIYSLCLYDATAAIASQDWAREQTRRLPPRTVALCKIVALLSLLYLFAGRWCVPGIRWHDYSSLPSLGLDGAERLHLAPARVSAYREITEYLQTNCDTFITVPGLNSLHFWAAKPPPTYFNAFESVWLSDAEQLQVIAALKEAKRPLIVVNEYRIFGEPDSAVMGHGALARFILRECHTVKTLTGCRILSPNSN